MKMKIAILFPKVHVYYNVEHTTPANQSNTNSRLDPELYTYTYKC